MNMLIITGPPYSGKGTQCGEIEKTFGYKHLSTGDRIRKEKENQTQLGEIFSAYAEKGELVPDAYMKELIDQMLEENKGQSGLLLDGYPRTKAQVDDLLEIINVKHLPIAKVINIEVEKPELLIRAKKRAESSNRIDDKDASTHIKRIEIFMDQTIPAIEYLKKKVNVISIDGMGDIKAISDRIIAAIK